MLKKYLKRLMLFRKYFTELSVPEIVSPNKINPNVKNTPITKIPIEVELAFLFIIFE